MGYSSKKIQDDRHKKALFIKSNNIVIHSHYNLLASDKNKDFFYSVVIQCIYYLVEDSVFKPSWKPYDLFIGIQVNPSLGKLS